MVTKPRQQRASVPELKRRIAARTSSGPENLSLAQACDLAALYGRAPAEFRDIIDKGELKRRKAYYLLRVGQLLETGAITQSDAEQIGWSKLVVIADEITAKNAPRLLNRARKKTVQELKREDDQKPAPHCVLMYFTPWQYRQFTNAVVLHGATSTSRGLAGKEKAIMRLIRATRRNATT